MQGRRFSVCFICCLLGLMDLAFGWIDRLCLNKIYWTDSGLKENRNTRYERRISGILWWSPRRTSLRLGLIEKKIPWDVGVSRDLFISLTGVMPQLWTFAHLLLINGFHAWWLIIYAFPSPSRPRHTTCGWPPWALLIVETQGFHSSFPN